MTNGYLSVVRAGFLSLYALEPKLLVDKNNSTSLRFAVLDASDIRIQSRATRHRF
jgi:hypothetical protein